MHGVDIFTTIVVALISLFFIWRLVWFVRNKPELFTFENLNKSFFSMGILAILLIVLVGAVVMLLRGGH